MPVDKQNYEFHCIQQPSDGFEAKPTENGKSKAKLILTIDPDL